MAHVDKRNALAFMGKLHVSAWPAVQQVLRGIRASVSLALREARKHGGQTYSEYRSELWSRYRLHRHFLKLLEAGRTPEAAFAEIFQVPIQETDDFQADEELLRKVYPHKTMAYREIRRSVRDLQEASTTKPCSREHGQVFARRPGATRAYVVRQVAPRNE